MGLVISDKHVAVAELNVNLFGVFNYLDGQQKQFSFKSRKTAAVLLALCLVGQNGIRREELAFLLWPDLTEERAKAGLRRALSRIRGISPTSIDKPRAGWVALNSVSVACDFWFLKNAIESNPKENFAFEWPTESFLVSYPQPTDIFSEWVKNKIDSTKNALKMNLFSLLDGTMTSSLDKKIVAQLILLLCPLALDANSRVLDFLRQGNHIKLFDSVFKAFQRRTLARGERSILDNISKENKSLFDELQASKQSDFAATSDRPSKMNTESRLYTKPILVVENFKFLGTNSDVRYLGEAVAEELLQRLSRQNWFSVQFMGLPGTYKPKGVKDHISNILCNSYMLSGTILADEDTARISVRLTDSSTNIVHWSEQYDNEMSGILSIQTEIVGKISEILSSKIISVEAQNITQNAAYDDSEIALDIWVNTMRARNLFWRTSRSNNAEAKALLEPVLLTELPPIPALVTAAFTRLVDTWSLWTETPVDDLEEARRLAEMAIKIDPSDPWAYFTLGTCLGAKGELKAAIHTFDRSLELNPNFSASIGARGKYKVFNGALESGMKDLEVALSMNDLDPHYGLWQQAYGIAKFLNEDLDDALLWCERAISTNSYWYHNYILSAAILSRQGNFDQGREEYTKVLKFLPEINSDNCFYGHPFRRREDKNKLVSALSVYGFR